MLNVGVLACAGIPGRRRTASYIGTIHEESAAAAFARLEFAGTTQGTVQASVALAVAETWFNGGSTNGDTEFAFVSSSIGIDAGNTFVTVADQVDLGSEGEGVANIRCVAEQTTGAAEVDAIGFAVFVDVGLNTGAVDTIRKDPVIVDASVLGRAGVLSFQVTFVLVVQEGHGLTELW